MGNSKKKKTVKKSNKKNLSFRNRADLDISELYLHKGSRGHIPSTKFGHTITTIGSNAYFVGCLPNEIICLDLEEFIFEKIDIPNLPSLAYHAST